MELHNQLGCYLSLKIESIGPIEGFNGFFHENSFIIAHRMFDPTLKEDEIEKEIHHKLINVYGFDPKDKNIGVVSGPSKIYVPSRKFYIPLPPGGVFVYKKDKLKVFI
jgi:hypothetical protein